MQPFVPFVHTLPSDEEAEWLKALNDNAKGYAVCPLKQLTPTILNLSELAIVANPDPAQSPYKLKMGAQRLGWC